MSLKNIVLIGMTCCGKSAAGKILSRRMRRPLIETDVCIEQAAKKTIAELFADEGEEKFRALESEVLNTALSQEGNIISTGGGVILSPSNRRQIRALGWAVYLSAPLSLLQKRLSAAEVARRPLLQKNPAALAQMLQQREVFYQQTAHLAVAQTAEESPLAVAKKIQAGLRHIITP